MKIISKSLLMLFVVSALVGTQANGMGTMRRVVQRVKNTLTQPVIKDRAKAAALVAVGTGAAFGGIGASYRVASQAYDQAKGIASQAYDQAKEKVSTVAKMAAEKARSGISYGMKKLDSAYYANAQKIAVYVTEHSKQNKVTDCMFRKILTHQKGRNDTGFTAHLMRPFSIGSILHKSPEAYGILTAASLQNQATFNRIPYSQLSDLVQHGLCTREYGSTIAKMAANRLEQPIAEHELDAFSRVHTAIERSHFSEDFAEQVNSNPAVAAKYKMLDRIAYKMRKAQEQIPLKQRTKHNTRTL